MPNKVSTETIFLLGIGYVMVPEDEVKDTILDEDMAFLYTRVFHIVPDPEGIPNYKHNDLRGQWERVW